MHYSQFLMHTKSSSFSILLLCFLSFSRANPCSTGNSCHSNSTCVTDASLQQGYHCSCNQHGFLSSSVYFHLNNRNIILPWKHQYCRENLALKGVASQSSTNMEHPSNAKNALDITRTSGDVSNHGCSLTTVTNDPWLMVDLRHRSIIRQVVVKRADCCPAVVQVHVGSSNVQGGVSNAHCGNLTVLHQDRYASFFCNPTRSGQYVTISYPGNNKELAICGLEVYSDFTDYDECSASDACVDEDRMLCINTIGSFTCECGEGTSFDDKRQICIDEDECQLGTHKCNANAYCHNTMNGFQCFCNKGLYGDGYTCKDVNECKTNEMDCGSDVKTHCINTLGSYNCTCVTGFTFDTHNKECVDIDECKNTEVLCRPGSCVNTYGSYKCRACQEGFSRQGWMCVDFDECMYGKYSCADNESCKNTVGSYICVCNQGYQRHDKVCSDIDECKTSTATCPKNSKCVNEMGGYKCVCKQGYREEENEEDELVCRSIIEELQTRSGNTIQQVHRTSMVIMLLNGIVWLYL